MFCQSWHKSITKNNAPSSTCTACQGLQQCRSAPWHMTRVGQNRKYTPYMTIWPYIWWFLCQKCRLYTVCIWFWPTLHTTSKTCECCCGVLPCHSSRQKRLKHWTITFLIIDVLMCMHAFKHAQQTHMHAHTHTYTHTHTQTHTPECGPAVLLPHLAPSQQQIAAAGALRFFPLHRWLAYRQGHVPCAPDLGQCPPRLWAALHIRRSAAPQKHPLCTKHNNSITHNLSKP